MSAARYAAHERGDACVNAVRGRLVWRRDESTPRRAGTAQAIVQQSSESSELLQPVQAVTRRWREQGAGCQRVRGERWLKGEGKSRRGTLSLGRLNERDIRSDLPARRTSDDASNARSGKFYTRPGGRWSTTRRKTRGGSSTAALGRLRLQDQRHNHCEADIRISQAGSVWEKGGGRKTHGRTIQ